MKIYLDNCCYNRPYDDQSQLRISLETISVIMREKFDYTKWQQQRFDNMSSEEFQNAAVSYAKKNPFSIREKNL